MENAERKMERVFKEHYQSLYKKAQDILSDFHLAEDAVHDAFLYVIKNNKPRDFLGQSDAYLLSYLYITVKHISIDICRSRKRHVVTDSVEINVTIENAAEEISKLFREWHNASFKEVFFELPDEYIYLLILRYVYGYNAKDLAERHNVSASAMRKRIQRAKEMIRKNYRKRHSI
jgi:RNA polymerase sigma-70 factor (ECF subfamily)